MAVSKTTIERDALSKAIGPQRDRAYEIRALTCLLASALVAQADEEDLAAALQVVGRLADDIAGGLEVDVLLGNLPRPALGIASLLTDAIDLINRDEKGDALERLSQIQSLLGDGGAL